MKHSIIIILILATHLVLGQTRKIEVYYKDGKQFTQRQKDSIWYKANQYVATKKLRETSDSAFYQLTYFDKALVPARYEKDGNYCGNPRREGKKKIRNLFPYNQLDKIKLVSFKLPHPDSVERTIPLKNGQVDMDGMFESVTLEKELSEKLLDILVNYDNPEDERLVLMCYDPRNAIIFMDKSDKILGYIELCFDCLDFKTEPKNIVMGGFCTEKFDAIQGIFVAAGLKYGMKRDME
jgi:hypothetical protein